MVHYGLVDKNARSCAIPLEKIRVRGTLKGFTAEITTTMEYHNDGDTPIEAVYVFPLDEEAAVCDFQATIDGRTIVAEVQGKQEARDTYDDAISSGHSAYLLEESDESSDIFQINVGNLPPKKSATVEMTFVSELSLEKEGRVVFVLPTVLNPRYTPQDSEQSVSSNVPTVASVIKKYSFDFEINVESASSIQEITSPCNRLKVDIDPEDNKRAQVRLEEYHFDADVQIQVLNSDPFKPFALVETGVTTTTKEVDDFMSKPVIMLNFFPDFRSSASLERGEFIFIVDRSGSMGGSNMKSAKETLLLFLKSLPDGCYFNVIGFGSTFQKLFPKSQVYSDATVDEACSHAQSINADLGGTEILEPLEDIYSQPLIQGYPRQVFLLTDGDVGNTRQVIDLVARNADKARCFGFGIGSGASTALIKGVARAGKGKADFAMTNDNMQSKVMKMLKNALQPALLDCSVDWHLPKGYSVESVPNPLPMVFSGESLFLYGSMTSDSKIQPDKEHFTGSVTLSTTVTTGSRNIQHKITFQGLTCKSRDTLMLHRLAAKAWIQTKQQNDYTENDKLKVEIIRRSQSANVISKLTSFVAIDKESHEPVARPMTTPSPLPQFEIMALSTSIMDVEEECFGCYYDQNKAGSYGYGVYDGYNEYSCEWEAGKSASQSSNANNPPQFCGDARSTKKNKSSFNPFSVQKSKTRSKSRKRTRNDMGPKRRSVLCASNIDESYDGVEFVSEFKEVGKCEAVKSASLSSNTNNPLQLVSLQKARGSWQLTSQLAEICGATLDKLKKACPSELTADDKESVWATALALSCLASKFGSKKDEWEIVASKGSKWLKETLKENTLSYEKIMEKAAHVIGN